MNLADLAIEQPDEPWHLDPRDKDPRSEGQRQLGVLKMARMICPSLDFIAIPNAGKRSQWEASQRKREGMTAGALDLVVTWEPQWAAGVYGWVPGIAFVEMKNGTTMPDDNQRDRLNMYHRWGFRCGVFRQERSLMRWLKDAGAPFIGVVT